jgi:hypothetical protein
MRADRLLIPLLAYTAASLFHYVHNAEFLDAYPGMQAWLARARVYGAWLGVTAVGLGGYFMLRAGHARSGLLLLAMNLAILLEAAMAAALLLAVAGFAVSRWRSA